MVIVDEKMLAPPPPYMGAPASPPPFPRPSNHPSLLTLPPHILLRIVYELFPQGQPEGQRRILYWLTVSLRQVNRALYVACMHILRSTYLPAYNMLVRPPYTSDPFPGPDPDHPDASPSPVYSLQRETRVLDLFITLKVREDVWTDESELHLEREESFKDLFDLMQPRSRLEDLVRTYGLREGVVAISRSDQQQSASTSRKLHDGARPVPFGMLSASFSPRMVGLVLTTKQRRKTIVEVARVREDSLERAAKQLVKALRGWVSANPNYLNAAS